MLILCSNGLSSDNLLNEFSKYASGLSEAALVVTADNEYKENNYHVERCKAELMKAGLKPEIIDIDKDSPEVLLRYDVVEFIGGNPYYLLDAIRREKALNVLTDIAENKILIGWSAAAFVFGPTLELINIYSPELNFLGLTDLTALGLTDTEVLPHYGKFINRFERFEERCAEYEQSKGINVVRLNDGDGIFITMSGEKQLIKA